MDSSSSTFSGAAVVNLQTPGTNRSDIKYVVIKSQSPRTGSNERCGVGYFFQRAHGERNTHTHMGNDIELFDML